MCPLELLWLFGTGQTTSVHSSVLSESATRRPFGVRQVCCAHAEGNWVGYTLPSHTAVPIQELEPKAPANFGGIKGKKSATATFNVLEKDLDKWPLRLNHYQIQSREHFERKRLTDPLRWHDGWALYDKDTIIDDTLSKKRNWKRPNVPVCGPEDW